MSQAKNDVWSDKSMKATAKKVDDFLADIAGGRVTVEEAFEYREDGGIRIALPQVPSKLSLKKAANMLLAQAEAEEAMYEYTQQIQCRPLDGAFSFAKVLKELYGMTPIGKEARSFFGSQPPELRYVKVSPTERVQVPWGLLAHPHWGAQFYLQSYQDPAYGEAFQIHVMAKKRYERQVQGLLALVEEHVRENSLYRGKAMRNTINGIEPEFYDPYEVNRETVVYSQPVFEALTDQIWGIIECAELIRESNKGYTVLDRETGLPVLDENGREVTERTHIRVGNNVLLWGENGTGKTLAAAITGQYCLENGWTFVEAGWDEDLKKVLRFVERVGSPSVVVIEDVENLFNQGNRMKELLGEFDGMRTKGFEVTLLMTSNHVGELPKSMLGGHRIDHTIYVSDLDKPGVERLVRKLVPSSQREELDFEALHEAYTGFTPSWIVRNLDDVGKHSIIRTKKVGQPHATEDFVRAAHALRPAWQLHQDATDRPVQPQVESALREIVRAEVANELQGHFVDIGSSGDILVRD
jgi:hypothetical protein